MYIYYSFSFYLVYVTIMVLISGYAACMDISNIPLSLNKFGNQTHCLNCSTLIGSCTFCACTIINHLY